MKLRTLAAAGAITIIALAGCGGGGGGGGGGSNGQSTAASNGPDRRQTLMEAAKCARENGRPDWPDPTLNENGDWAFPDSVLDTGPPAACAAQFRSAKGHQGPSRRPLSAAEMAELRKWADCIRTHNVPDWPDPDDEGVFHPPAGLGPAESNPQLRDAQAACKSLEPASGVKVRLPPGVSKTDR